MPLRAEFNVAGLLTQERWSSLPVCFRRAGICPTNFDDTLLFGSAFADVQLLLATIHVAVIDLLLHAYTGGFRDPVFDSLRGSALFKEWCRTKRASKLHSQYHMQL